MDGFGTSRSPECFSSLCHICHEKVGSGSNTLFWSDRWLHGCTIESLAPTVFAGIPPRIRKKRTVAEALENGTWLQDIRSGGDLSWHGIREFLRLWNYLLNIALTDHEDHHIWKYEASGCYSSKSAYKAYFNGSVTFEPWCRIWKTWAPQKCKFFLWLAIKNRCWTADRLARRGLDHPER